MAFAPIAASLVVADDGETADFAMSDSATVPGHSASTTGRFEKPGDSALTGMHVAEPWHGAD